MSNWVTRKCIICAQWWHCDAANPHIHHPHILIHLSINCICSHSICKHIYAISACFTLTDDADVLALRMDSRRQFTCAHLTHFHELLCGFSSNVAHHFSFGCVCNNFTLRCNLRVFMCHVFRVDINAWRPTCRGGLTQGRRRVFQWWLMNFTHEDSSLLVNLTYVNYDAFSLSVKP